jgi:hypothetical protein
MWRHGTIPIFHYPLVGALYVVGDSPPRGRYPFRDLSPRAGEVLWRGKADFRAAHLCAFVHTAGSLVPYGRLPRRPQVEVGTLSHRAESRGALGPLGAPTTCCDF